MKKIMKSITVFTLMAVLFGCSSADFDSSSGIVNPETVEQAKPDPAEVITSVKWTYKNPKTNTVGTQTFTPDGKGSLNGSGQNFKMNWEIKEDGTLYTSFSMNGKKYSSTYEIVENNGEYELHNVDHPDTIWKPAK